MAATHTIPRVGDLTNPILPLFSRSNFTSPNWNYHLLAPSLRLASRLLDTNSLLEYPHAIFHGPTHQLPHPTHPLETYTAFFRCNEPGSPLSTTQLHEARTSILNLADCVTFLLSSEPIENRTSVRAQTVALEDQPSDFGGYKVSITFTAAEYGKLSDPHRSAEVSTLGFADLLCHELMHAMALVCGRSMYEPFEYDMFSEGGFEWTQHIFGGVLDSSAGHVVELVEYPFASFLNDYDPEWLTLVREVPRVEVRWNVTEDFVKKVHTMAFWEGGGCGEGGGGAEGGEVVGG